MKTKHDKEAEKLGHKTLNGVCVDPEKHNPQYTPTPWSFEEYDGDPNGHYFEIWGRGQRLVKSDSNIENDTLDKMARANVSFIVKAVNCHEELLHMLKSLHGGMHKDCDPCELIAKAEGK